MRWWPFPWPKGWREEKPPEDEETEEPRTLKESAVLFARDLAVAFLIVAIVMGALFAYTGIWPPMVVVESDSMQHSSTTAYNGVIDTGDLVLVQGIRVPADIVTYVEGRVSGYETYGNYGDVMIFLKPSDPADATPIIHRAILFAVPNPAGGADVPALAGQGDWTGVKMDDSLTTDDPTGLKQVTIHNVRSWDSGAPPSGTVREATYPLTNIPEGGGFLTKGDHNGNPDPWGAIVVSRVTGRARGELPWFGLIKLTLAPGRTGCCPDGWGDTRAPHNSWDALLVSLVLIIVGPFAADFGWSWYKDWRKERRKRLPSPVAAANPEPPKSDATPSEVETMEPEVTNEARTESSEPEGGDRGAP